MDSLLKPSQCGIVAVVLLVALSTVTPLVGAQSSQPAWGDDLFRNAEDMAERYNSFMEGSEPSRIAKQVAGEKINLVITDRSSGETVTFSFRSDDRVRLRELRQEPRDDATLTMSTDRATIRKINAADRPHIVYKDAIESGDIKITGVTLVNKLKWSAINLAGSLLRMLR
jgi:hypothetical protein